MSASIRGLGKIGNGALTDVGLSIMQLGMVTGLHAAISPSFFTFACFAKKPEEREIAKRTLWISWIATTVVNVGILFAFKRWAPAVAGQIAGTGLFIGGMMACSDKNAPELPSMAPKPLPENVAGMGRIGYNPTQQPKTLKAQDHWLDRRFPDTYKRVWDSDTVPMI